MAKKSARASKLLNEMRLNPKADWRLEQLDTVARAHDVNVRQGRGSHVVFEHPKRPVSTGTAAHQAGVRPQVRRFDRSHPESRGGRGDAERKV